MKTKNDFINCPPFGLYDIFNHLIYHSSEYDKQGLAAFKSYEDYRLYEDGYVRSLETILVQEAGIHVCVGKVQPTMRAKTDDGKDFYDLWFILEGRGPNRGSVIEAYCKCKGGRDGGCKHIASAMYSLEALLNSRGEESVTSGTCQWKPKTQSNSEPCEIKDVLIEKIKPPSNKRKKKSYTWLQNIEFDPRSSQDRKPRKKRSMSRFTKRLCPPDPPKEDFDGTPVILPLLKKLHLSCETKQDAGSMLQEVQVTNTKTSNNQGIMQEKISEYLKNNKERTPEHFKESLVFTESEIEEVDKNTTAQWKCKQWHLHKVGFISASKCKEVFTRQTTLEKTSDTTPTRLAKSITTYNYSDNISKESVIEPNNPRDWGLKHENSARESYLRVQNHLHHKVKLTSRGFVISKSKPFIGASVDDVRSCKCVQNCDRVIVEYKCPWLHKELNPKEAFLTKEIGGQQIGNKLQLKRDAKYFYQIQMQMFVLGLKLCEFVVWTKKGITTIQVPHDSTFTKTVCAKLEKFWISQVVPLMLPTAVHIPNQEADQDGEVDQHDSVQNRTNVDVETDSSPAKTSLKAYGIDITAYDISSLAPLKMINDNMVTVLLREQPCQFPIIDCLFYSVLSGEQDGMWISSRQSRFKGAEKFFKPEHYKNEYVVIPIVRSNHWFLMILTPWHMLIFDSLTWDIANRVREVDLVTRYLDHMCELNNLDKKHTVLQPVILKVPQQSIRSNNCGIYVTMFLEYYMKEMDFYEQDPVTYVQKEHHWFTREESDRKRIDVERYWKTLHAMHVIQHKHS